MNWKVCNLEDICYKVLSGGTPLTSRREYYENGTIPWLKTTEIHKEIIRETETYITEDGLKNSSAKLIPENSILIAMYGDGHTAGNVAITKIPLCTNQACCNLIIDQQKADYGFIYYYLKANRDNLVNLKSGGSQQNLNALTIKKFPILLPEISIQKEISSLLSNYDDLIEVNNQRIKLLEETAQEFYKEWFVRMRFPGYKNAKLEKGVPNEWQIAKLGDVLELAYGKSLKEENRVDGVFPVYGSSGVVGFHNTYLVNAPGIVVGRKGNVGSVFWVDNDFFPIDTAFYVKTNFSLYYIYFNLQSQHFIEADAAVPGLNRNQAYSNYIFIPDDGLLSKFDAIIEPIFKQIENLQQQNNQLRQIRDRLLPRLISGKLKLKTTEEAPCP